IVNVVERLSGERELRIFDQLLGQFGKLSGLELATMMDSDRQRQVADPLRKIWQHPLWLTRQELLSWVGPRPHALARKLASDADTRCCRLVALRAPMDGLGTPG